MRACRRSPSRRAERSRSCAGDDRAARPVGPAQVGGRHARRPRSRSAPREPAAPSEQRGQRDDQPGAAHIVSRVHAFGLPPARRRPRRGRPRLRRLRAGGLRAGRCLVARLDGIRVATRDGGGTGRVIDVGDAAALAAKRRLLALGGAGPWSVYLGFAGLSAGHREGDGTTPTGAFALGPVMYGVAPDPGVHFAYHRLVCGDWWDEDPARRPTTRSSTSRAGHDRLSPAASEALWRSTRAYSHLIFVEYNTAPAVPGPRLGDLHPRRHRPPDERLRLARPGATRCSCCAGCGPSARPLIVIGTASGIAGY